MSKFFKSFLLVLAISISLFILLTSFNVFSQSKMTDTPNFKSRKFYVQKEILPDHSLYPVLMLFDRLRLSMADRERRIYLLVAYAKRRVFYASRLIEKEEAALAFSTFTKAQKYYNQALQEVKTLNDENTHDPAVEQLVFFVLEAIDEHQEVVEENLNYFTDADNRVLKSLHEETTLLRDQLLQ